MSTECIYQQIIVQENLVLLHVNNTDTDPPTHTSSLISAFFILSMLSMISKLASYKTSTF